MIFGERLRGFRWRDDLQAKVAHRAKLSRLGLAQRSCPAPALETELLAVALEDVLDEDLATQHNPVGEVPHPAAQGLG